MAIVATEGMTDFGSFDPLAQIVEIADENAVWLHVDAAYGGALLLSQRYRQKLAGIERADSVTIDFHKAFYQPISCSAFLIANGRNFDFIRHQALPRRLFEQGAAVIGYTCWRGRRILKLTVLNPCASEKDLEGLVEIVVAHGRALELENSLRRPCPLSAASIVCHPRSQWFSARPRRTVAN